MNLKKLLYKIISILVFIILVICFIDKYQVKASVVLVWSVPGHTQIRSNGWHEGRAIDIGDSYIYGANIVAAMGGTVLLKYNCGENHIDDGKYYWENGNMVCNHYCNGFGTGIVIRGDDNRTYEYAHMIVNSIPESIVEGEYVKAGQKIGQVGSTGMSSGPHLHFGITANWNYYESSGINPINETYNYNGDPTPPTIQFAYIDERSLDGYSYKVVVTASDESGIDRVEVRTFTPQKFGSNGRSDDDLVVNNAVYNTHTGNYESMVYKSEHNFEDGLYLTEIYVWDKKGNYAHKVFESISINSVRTDIGEFEGRITLKYDRNYVIGIEPKSWNVNNVVLRKKDLNDDSQVWNFKKGDSGDYKITNKSTGLVMDVERMEDVNGTNVQAYTSNEKVNQRFYIFKYNDGYRLSARCSADLKGIDVPNLKLEDGHNITIGKTNSPTNNAQTFIFEPVGYEVLYPKGDINGDDKVTLIDYGMVLAHVKRTKLLEGEQLARADVNEDGKVTLIDYGLILAHVKRTKLMF